MGPTIGWTLVFLDEWNETSISQLCVNVICFLVFYGRFGGICHQLLPLAALEEVTIVDFMAVAGPCPRGTQTLGLDRPHFTSDEIPDAGASFLPVTATMGSDNGGDFSPSQVHCAFSIFLVNHATTNLSITLHRSPSHRQERFGPSIPFYLPPDLLVSRAFSLAISISNWTRGEAYSHLQPRQAARATFSTPSTPTDGTQPPTLRPGHQRLLCR